MSTDDRYSALRERLTELDAVDHQAEKLEQQFYEALADALPDTPPGGGRHLSGADRGVQKAIAEEFDGLVSATWLRRRTSEIRAQRVAAGKRPRRWSRETALEKARELTKVPEDTPEPDTLVACAEQALAEAGAPGQIVSINPGERGFVVEVVDSDAAAAVCEVAWRSAGYRAWDVSGDQSADVVRLGVEPLSPLDRAREAVTGALWAVYEEIERLVPAQPKQQVRRGHQRGEAGTLKDIARITGYNTQYLSAIRSRVADRREGRDSGEPLKRPATHSWRRKKAAIEKAGATA